MNIDNATLNEVAQYLADGRITRSEADVYIEKWNTATFRFTFAERMGNSIVQHPRCGDCGTIRREHDNSHRFVN